MTLKPGGPLKRKKQMARTPALSRSPRQRKAPRDTGFSRPVKLAVRARAGNGEIEDAECEGCGTFLGAVGGQVHHRLARQAGGCKLAVVNSAANALLLCGTPEDKSTCHGLATAWDEEMVHAGFVLRHGNNLLLHDPRYVGILWHALGGSGALMYLTMSGEYWYEPAGGGGVTRVDINERRVSVDSLGRRRTWPSIAERLWWRVDKSGGPDACWPWSGARTTTGSAAWEGQVEPPTGSHSSEAEALLS